MAQQESSILEKVKYDEPHKYTVIFHNDDFTTMDFVVYVLMSVFRKSEEEALQLMLTVHHSGQAAVGTYSYDVAASKAAKATALAREEGFPLRITLQPNS